MIDALAAPFKVQFKSNQSAPIEIMENLFFIQRGYLNANHFVYFGTNYRSKYDEIMKGFWGRGIVKNQDGTLFTSVKP